VLGLCGLISDEEERQPLYAIVSFTLMENLETFSPRVGVPYRIGVAGLQAIIYNGRYFHTVVSYSVACNSIDRAIML
jgi:hypothetical protein